MVRGRVDAFRGGGFFADKHASRKSAMPHVTADPLVGHTVTFCRGGQRENKDTQIRQDRPVRQRKHMYMYVHDSRTEGGRKREGERGQTRIGSEWGTERP